jgi:hypothetical protein
MWMKDNKPLKEPLISDGKQIFNPSEEQIRKAGYEWVEPAVPVFVKKYSTLKIIRTLGEDWEVYRKQLESAGVLDQFFAANYLAEDDPVFVAFLETVPEEVKAMLDMCLWEER